MGQLGSELTIGMPRATWLGPSHRPNGYKGPAATLLAVNDGKQDISLFITFRIPISRVILVAMRCILLAFALVASFAITYADVYHGYSDEYTHQNLSHCPRQSRRAYLVPTSDLSITFCETSPSIFTAHVSASQFTSQSIKGNIFTTTSDAVQVSFDLQNETGHVVLLYDEKAQSVTAFQEGALIKREFDLERWPKAKCNDGSPGAYYFEPSGTGSDIWMLHYQGGEFVLYFATAVILIELLWY